MTSNKTPNYISKSLRVVEKYKSYFGFADWIVRFDDKTTQVQEQTETMVSLAECEFDGMEKVLTLTLYKNFLKTPENQFDILIHELIHARVGLMEDRYFQRVERIKYLEEEDCVNDITRGFVRLAGDK